ncbi:MAG TPA: phosphatase PAP2 family protein [Thermoleophilaceae bacterium]|nr:phosphatase PAP2 family protein [Thermoleophilaceae bacterium]
MDLAGRRARILTLAAVLLFIGGTVAAVVTQGLELSYDWLFIWLLLGLLALSLTDVKRWARGVVFDWLPFALFLLAYDFARGVADNIGIAPHTSTGIDFDRALFGHTLPTNWLQDRLFDVDVAHWYDYVTFFVYLSHFFVTLIVAAFLWRYRYPLFRRWRAMVMGIAATGFATYALFPGTPPWLASQDGRLPPITRTIGYMWQHVGVYPAAALFETSNRYVNEVAAIPSLHAAYTLLVVLFFWRRVPMWARPLLLLYPLAMGFTLVYTGEHYVFDVVLGWVYAVGVYSAVLAFERYRAGSREEPARTPLTLDESRVRA